MLIQQPKVHIVSKEVVLGNGESVFAFFALINMGGAVEVRFLGTKTAPAQMAKEDAVLTLPAAFTRAPLLAAKAVFQTYVAPFVYTLVFLVNQPPRAPAIA
ncbi:MAG TPA: hypothetical protein VIR98_01095 [Candidatus Paceibacterota bacterium]|jgi:hypothetical protein